MQRVLVVDNSHLIHAVIKRMLADRTDLVIDFASNGEEALDVVRACGGAPPLLLLDINMPFMNGLEVLTQLGVLGVRDQMKVIIVSTEGNERDVLRALEAGADAYLLKPFTVDALRDVIDGVLAHQIATSRPPKRAGSA